MRRLQGSCTACILCVKGSQLHAVNLGDSGFVVVRNGNVVKKSASQQVYFYCPYQLISPEAGVGQMPHHADVSQLENSSAVQ